MLDMGTKKAEPETEEQTRVAGWLERAKEKVSHDARIKERAQGLAFYDLEAARRKQGGLKNKRRDVATFRHYCREIAVGEVLDFWLEQVVTKGEWAMEASKMLAAYGFGRPTERVEVQAETVQEFDLSKLTLEQTVQLKALLAQAKAKEKTVEGEFTLEAPKP